MADSSNRLARLNRDDRRGLVRYWFICEPQERRDVLRLVLEHPAQWRAMGAFPMLGNVGSQLPDEWPTFARTVVQAFDRRSAPLEELAEACALAVCTAPKGPSSQPLVDALVAAFVQQAGPSEARWALQLLVSATHHLDQALWCDRLLAWLIERGGAETRRTADPLVAVAVLNALTIALERSNEQLEPLLQIVATSEKPSAVLTVDGTGDHVLWPACERALERGASVDLIVEVFAAVLGAIGPLGSDRMLEPLRRGEKMRAAAFAALARMPGSSLVEDYVWQAALRYAPVGGHLLELGALCALRAIAMRIVPPNEHTAAWGELIADSWFHHFGVARSDEPVPGVWQLDELAVEPEFAPGIARALRRVLAHEPALKHAAAREWLADAPGDPRFATIALLYLDDTSEPEAAVPADLPATLTAIATYPHGTEPFGPLLARQFARVTRVSLSDEINRDVVVEGATASDGSRTLRTGPVSTYRDLCRRCSPREAIAQCALFFVHEVLHVEQGIQKKSTVTTLREIGSEHSLLHFDLEADYIAASAVAVALSDYSFLELRGMQIDGTAAFPATMRHTNSSIFRKALRLVSLVAEEAVRANGRHLNIEPDELGYAAVELPPAGGPLILTWTAQVRRVVGTVQITEPQARELASASTKDAQLSSIRALVGKLVQAMIPTSCVA